MAYKRKTYDCGVCKDIEYTWAGNYGAKGESTHTGKVLP